MKTGLFKLLLLPLGLLFLFINAGYGKPKADQVESEVQKLTLDIPSLYLVNGLFLSTEQNRKLAGILKETAKIQRQNQQAIQAFITSHKQETDILLEQMIYGKKDSLSPNLKGKIRPNMQLFKLRGDWNNLINRRKSELDELARTTLDLLTDAQRDIVERFAPCFIPPGDFRNPERAGQADGDTSLAESKQPGRDEELGKVKLYILNAGIASVIARRAGDPGADFQEDFNVSAAFEEAKQKNQTFRTAAVINWLQLTAGQARQILPLVQKAIATRAAISAEAGALQPKALQAYQALKKELENQQVSPETEKNAAQYHHELKMLVMDKLAAALLQGEAEMDEILSADQVAFLSKQSGGRKGGGFQRDEAGQSSISDTRSRAREVFDFLDRVNDKEFNARVRETGARFVEDCVSGGMIEAGAIDRKAETERIQQALIKAKKMRSSEYQKNREDLIAEICPKRSMPRETKYNWQKSGGDRLAALNPSTELLFSQTGLTLLEKKIQVGN